MDFFCGIDKFPFGIIDICDPEVVTNGTADIILGITATLLTVAVHLQSVPTFWRIWNTKTTRKLLPFPYMFALVNSSSWLIYSIISAPVTGVQFQVVCVNFSNGIGFVVEYIYLMIFWHFNREPGSYKMWAVLLTFISCVFWIFLPHAWLMALKVNVMPLLTVIGIMMYVSPVFTIIHVSKTKLVEYLPFQLLKILCLNGFVWTIYTCLPQTFNGYLAILNGVGTICAISLLGAADFLRVKIGKSIACESAQDDRSNDRLGDLKRHLLLV